MSDATAYQITIKSSGGSSRHLLIITDTIQAALSIAKCKCSYNETVAGVYELEDDLYVDYSVCKEKS